MVITINSDSERNSMLICFIYIFYFVFSIISYGKNHFDLRVFWITIVFPKRIMLAIQGSTVEIKPCIRRANPSVQAVTVVTITYQNECVNINPSLQPEQHTVICEENVHFICISHSNPHGL